MIYLLHDPLHNEEGSAAGLVLSAASFPIGALICITADSKVRLIKHASLRFLTVGLLAAAIHVMLFLLS